MDKRWLLPLAPLAFTVQGCFLLLLGGGAAAGAGAVIYARGELQAVETTSIQRTWDATHDAMRDLGFAVTDQEKNPDSATLQARTKDNDEVNIRLQAKGVTATEIGIRVGTFGNEALSRVILEKIQRNIGTS